MHTMVVSPVPICDAGRAVEQRQPLVQPEGPPLC